VTVGLSSSKMADRNTRMEADVKDYDVIMNHAKTMYS
jgi:hypothetical protein